MRFSVDTLAASIASMRRGVRWLLLAGISTVLVLVLEWLAIPAALLLGPMLAAVTVGVLDIDLHVSPFAYRMTQALVGTLIATAVTPDIVASFLADWPLFFAVVIAIVFASSWIGWRISRADILPGTTGIWGSSPGAASAMVLMADAFGADARLVAFMQYLRVICVTLAAALLAAIVVDGPHGTGSGVHWFPAFTAREWLTTAGLVALGVVLGCSARIPSGAFMGPMVIGGVLNSMGLISPALPPWLLAAGYVVLGWSVGLGFTMPVLRIALGALPWILASIAALMAFCGGLALLLVWVLGIDPLTAYLATSPGGLDSIAIIAAASNVDLAFVVTLQTARFVIVILAGPPLARLVTRLSSDRDG
ncbi:AbrB family transcriptional regulator [Pseudochelatococcus sp. B33]